MTCFLSDYSLSTCERLYVVASLGVLGGLPYAERHLDEARTHWLHYVIALIEVCPLIGGVAALVEYAVHTIFIQEPPSSTAAVKPAKPLLISPPVTSSTTAAVKPAEPSPVLPPSITSTTAAVKPAEPLLISPPATSSTTAVKPAEPPPVLPPSITSTTTAVKPAEPPPVPPPATSAAATPRAICISAGGMECPFITTRYSGQPLYLNYIDIKNNEYHLFAILQTENEILSKHLEKTSREQSSEQLIEQLKTSGVSNVANKLLQSYAEAATYRSTDVTVFMYCFDKQTHMLHRATQRTVGYRSTFPIVDFFTITIFSKQAETVYNIQQLRPGASLKLQDEDHLFVHANHLSAKVAEQRLPQPTERWLSDGRFPYHHLEIQISQPPSLSHKMIQSPLGTSTYYPFQDGMIYLNHVEKSDARRALFAIFQTFGTNSNLLTKQFATEFAPTFAQRFGAQFLEKIQTPPDDPTLPLMWRLMLEWTDKTGTPDALDQISTAACVVYIDKAKQILHHLKAPETGTHDNAFLVTICSVQSATKTIVSPGTTYQLKNADHVFIHEKRHRDRISEEFLGDPDFVKKIESISSYLRLQKSVYHLEITTES